MATIVTRSGKGSPLTNNEVDANFTNLNTDKAELSGATFTGEITANGGIALGDNDKATFGASDDLQIFHSGTNSHVKDAGTGSLLLQGDSLYLSNAAGNLTYFYGASSTGAAQLRYGNSPKLTTTSSGIDVTGNVVADGLTVDGSVTFNTDTLKISDNLPKLVFEDTDTSTLASITANSSHITYDTVATSRDHIFKQGGTTRMVIDDTGIDVTGKATMDGLVVAGGSLGAGGNDEFSFVGKLAAGRLVSDAGTTNIASINSTYNDDVLELTAGASNNYVSGIVIAGQATTADSGEGVKIFRRSVPALGIDGNGDISFYEDTGTTPKLTWDASAESLNFADNGKATFGAGDDLQIYHDGFNTLIKESGAGSLLIDATNTYFRNAAGTKDYAWMVDGGAVSLFHNNSNKLATTSTGIEVTGTATMDGLAVGTTSDAYSQVLINSSTTGESELRMGDTDTDAGSIAYTNSDDTMTFRAAAGARMTLNSTGIDVTGSVVADGLSVDGGVGSSLVTTLKGGTSSQLIIQGDADNIGDSGELDAKLTFASDGGVAGWDIAASNGSGTSTLQFLHNNKKYLNISSGGDISFYEDTGTTPKLFWDASAESLGIGTSSPDGDLDVRGAGLADLIVRATSANSTSRLLMRNDAQSFALRINGDDKFRIKDETADADRLVVDTSGRVGIGTSSPSSILSTSGTDATTYSSSSVGGQDSSATLKIQNLTTSANTFASIDFNTNNNRVVNRIVSSHGSTTTDGFLAFVTEGSGTPAERMRIDSTGKVGIGTDSPASKLHLADTSTVVTFEDTNSTNNSINTITNYEGTMVLSVDPNNNSTVAESMRFSMLGTERMRIDSSGNLLVGKTATGLSTDGAELAQGGTAGKVQITRTSNAALLLNRRSTDGTIADFRKDGTSVGSIGTRANDLSIGTGDTGLNFWDASNNIIPESLSAGAARDNAISLGASNVRFKDLYLSGGVSTNTATGLSITADSNNRGILNLSTSQAYQLIGGTHYGYTGYKTGGYHRWFGSDASEDMRLDSSGNLLVGTTNTAPATNNVEGIVLRNEGHINVSRASGVVGYFNRKTNDGTILSFHKDGTSVGSIGTASSGDLYIADGRNAGIKLDGGNNQVLPVTSAGSPLDATLDLGSSGTRFKDLYLSGTLNGDKYGIHTEGGGSLYQTDGYLRFANGNTETARIDSSGNLLVGTTSATGRTDASSGEGIALSAGSYGGFIGATRSGANPLALNRLSTDGAIATFAKDGTTVGSIGSVSGDVYIGSGDTGIRFHDGTDSIFPVTAATGADRGSTVNLGHSTNAFKDLYLSGGVYLGGTGAANKLDDYEEGNWTPVYSPQTGSFTTLAMDTPSASYTKIGNTVVLRAFIRTDDVDITGASGALRVAGLPFSVNKYQAVATSYALGGNWTNSISSGYADTGGFIVLLKAGELTATPQDMVSGTNANKNSLMLEVSYETTV